MIELSVCADKVVASPNLVYKSKCINIADGRIRAITGHALSSRVIDYRGQQSILIPSPVDMHVHLRGLMLRYKEDVYTGTLAAVNGGIGVVADMPNTQPPITSTQALQEKLDELSQNALVDYVVYAGVPSEPEQAQYLAMRTAGFKLYPDDLTKDVSVLCEVFRRAQEAGKIVVLHAEVPELSRHDDGWHRDVLRPCQSELAAVRITWSLLNKCSAKPHVHITHVSCSYTVELAQEYGFTTDTTLHHLYADMLVAETCLEKVNPPLRQQEASRLRQLLVERRINCIASDHAPHSVQEKRSHPAICPPGIASLDHWPRILVSRYKSYGLGLLASVMSREPARILGLAGVGCLEPGCKAYASLYLLDHERVVENEGSKAKPSIYFMYNEAQLALLVVRGGIVYEIDHGVLVEPGYGINLVDMTSS